PTGSGKTLAAFLAALDDLVRRGLADELGDETLVVYISPLKALSNDVEKNLEEPLAGIRAELVAQGLPDVEIRTAVRTGDTPLNERAAMNRRPPHILVTTPESLYILLTSEGGRRMLKTARTVIVDEIHAVADDKRGSHLSLSLERLEALVGEPLTRIGLSATQKPIEEVARFLVGSANVEAGTPRCVIVDAGHGRRMDLAIEVPGSPLEAVMSHEVWAEIYDRLAELAREHRTTLVFANTRRLAERIARHLAERLGEDKVAAHHGSLSKEQRLASEHRLKTGQLSLLIATASLELGIDIGSVDLVCQIGSPRSIATLLQRVGRSGHHLGGLPKGRIFPQTRDELIECAALIDAARRGELDHLIIPDRPIDILAQQIVAAASVEEWREDDLFALVRRAWPYRDLPREGFDEVVEMLASGFATRRGRRGAYLHHDAVNGRLRGRRGAMLTAITSGGAIPDLADYQVVLQPSGAVIGTLNEDFAVESHAGDIFQLGNASWRVLKIEAGRVLVEDAKGQPPTIPFWLGEAPGRTEELGLPFEAARQIVDYLAAGRAALGTMPTQDTLVAERFFDEAGDMHMVVHAPFGSRVNRAWGLALRKRFCRMFNFELQAAATEDAIVLSLGPTHSFPLEDAFRFLHSSSVRDVLTQAVLDAPIFGVRWRWNAGRALAIPRSRGGRRVPPPLLRQQAEDLVAVVFPDQLACLENIVGEREVPDHPLVAQTLRDCLEEAMDIEALEKLLRRIESGKVELVARDLTEPSPLAHEILNAQVYAFLDDAPLEERRTHAVITRRWLDPATASDLGALDAAAIDRVREEAWPEAFDPDELHDALMTLGYVTEEEGRRSGWEPFFHRLIEARRAAVVKNLWVAAERWPQIRAVHLDAPEMPLPERLASRQWTPEAAIVELVRGRMEAVGPTTAEALARSAGVERSAIDLALAALEGEGFVLRGRFTPGPGGREGDQPEWCERRLLARVHRYTLDRLRREIEPVSQADFVRFLLAWHRLEPDERMEGPESVQALLEQLEGFEAAAAAWEGEILPSRMKEYDPVWLDALCLAGRWVWGRAAVSNGSGKRSGPVRATPISLLGRPKLPLWREIAPRPDPVALDLTAPARGVHDYLRDSGASFFSEIAEGAGLLHTQVEVALAELVAWGLVTSDSFTGLRALLVPAHLRPPVDRTRRRGSVSVFGMENAGRWSLTRAGAPAEDAISPEAAEHIAWTLLRRYGVVFRRLLERETLLPPWRDLLRVFRRLEARGEIRGGRFVDGFSGEQYALPEAVGRLRAIRKEPKKGTLISVSAVDPLNLIGIATPGDRLAALSGNRLLYRVGVPIAVLDGKE
ncbi:MAG TPA: DEAD/DEAH box helicase, partial [Thermoanaerobaculia bacterium]